MAPVEQLPDTLLKMALGKNQRRSESLLQAHNQEGLETLGEQAGLRGTLLLHPPHPHRLGRHQRQHRLEKVVVVATMGVAMVTTATAVAMTRLL